MITRSNFEEKSDPYVPRTKLQYNVSIMPSFYHYTEVHKHHTKSTSSEIKALTVTTNQKIQVRRR